jgi:hypothetical protein
MTSQTRLHRLIFYSGQVAFFALIIALVAYTEFFYSDRKQLTTVKTKGNYTSPLFLVDDIDEYSIKNHKGVVRLKKHLSGAWYVQNEKGGPNFFAKEELIKTLLTESSAIHFKSQYILDSINKVNYSLASPMATIFINKSNTPLFQLVVGITNPVNNSTYITINQSGLIYQIEKFSLNLATMTKEDFQDGTVIPFHFNKISSFEWSEYAPANNGKNAKSQKLTRDERGNWYGQSGTIVKPEAIESILKELRSLRTNTMVSRSNLDEAVVVKNDGAEGLEQVVNTKHSEGQVLYQFKLNFVEGEMPFQILKMNNDRAPAAKNSNKSPKFEFYFENEGLSAVLNQESVTKLSQKLKELPLTL